MVLAVLSYVNPFAFVFFTKKRKKERERGEGGGGEWAGWTWPD